VIICRRRCNPLRVVVTLYLSESALAVNRIRGFRCQELFIGVFGAVQADLQAIGRLKPLRFLEFR